MSGLIKISEAASLALHTMAMLAAAPKQQFNTREIASIVGASENHLSKVLQRLTKAGMVKPARGPAGGFKIAKMPGEISLLDIYEFMEGSLVPTTCLLENRTCCGDNCILGNLLTDVDQKVRDYLNKTKLSDLVSSYNCKIKNFHSPL